ncbi:alpha-1,2-mannosyltransferase [Streptomyces sp. PsTaAH-137]|uniref:glycosyltransferase 87 family protein n=2 Tax=unclassified Streptomyces TaxID=2593676 RepID=UPI000DC2D221|nr:alpha-1,2-mannosyltransferase [Streptomyces sp. PsTaAH-137]
MIPRTHKAAPYLLPVTSAAALITLCLTQHTPMSDVLVYRAEGAAAAAGGRHLYDFTVTEWQLPATYPPFAALLFIPTTWLPLPALKAAFLLANIALTAALVHLSWHRLAGLPARAGTLCTATALALWLEPVFQTAVFGQINLALACLILWDLTREDGAPAKGLALGVAAGIKLTPAVFIAYLFLTGKRREATYATAGFAGTAAVGALVLPYASGQFWTGTLYETGRVGKAWIVDNQSLQGLVARTLHTTEPGLLWALPTALVAVAGLYAATRLPTPQGIVVTAVTALLVSPISWSHHWVWCVPLLALLWARGQRRTAVAVAVVFTARTMWLLPHQGDLDLALPWWQQPLAAPYPLLGLVLIAAWGQLSARSSSASTIRYA